MEYSNLFVCLMGMGTVFIGLICIIILMMIMSRVVRSFEKKPAKAPEETRKPAAVQSRAEITPELVAAVSAAIAEEIGTDISAIRIVSMKKA